MTTIWQDNVEAFAQRRDETGDRIDTERAATIHAATHALVRRGPGYAYYVLTRGVRRQWLAAGIGELQLGPEAHPSEVLAAWDRSDHPPVRVEVLIWPRFTTAAAR